MYYMSDPWFLLVIAAVLLGMMASAGVKRTYERYSRQMAVSGVTGAAMARRILDSYGLAHVGIAEVPGSLTDHYDPRSGTLRLSRSVAGSSSVAALGIAAHEAGHAVQHAMGYGAFRVRSALVPVANLGSQLLWPLIIAGFVLQLTNLFLVGAILYGGALAFHLVTLPVELDASRRAMSYLSQSGDLSGIELSGANRVLRAAAFTYVAAALVSIAQMLRLVMLSRRR
ncbi:zinc metallopeptidase [Candidatus Fermentibacterales bacterium]|nr:zinc metallopeptidase [Candidatus Fermentibacterales bacterium]